MSEDVLNRKEVKLYGRLCAAGLDPDYAEVKARKRGHEVTEHSLDHVAGEIIEDAADRWFEENGSAPSGSDEEEGGSTSSSSGGEDFYDRLREEARKEFDDSDDDEGSGW